MSTRKLGIGDRNACSECYQEIILPTLQSCNFGWTIPFPNEHTPFLRIGGEGIADSPPASLPRPSCTASGGIPCDSDEDPPLQESCSGGCGLCSFNPGCDGFEKSRAPECVAAASRFCKSICSNCGGIIQQVNAMGGVFGVSCFLGNDYTVSIEDLRQHFSCSLPSLSQSNECNVAVSRWCSTNRHGSHGIYQEVAKSPLSDGMYQEVGFSVSCFDASWFGQVLLSDLTSRYVPNAHGNYLCHRPYSMIS